MRTPPQEHFIWPPTPARATFSPDGRYVAAIDNHGHVDAWDAGTGRLIRATHKTSSGAAITVAPGDGSITYTDIAGDVTVQGLRSGHVVRTLSANAATVIDVSFAAGASQLVTVGSDGAIRVWRNPSAYDR